MLGSVGEEVRGTAFDDAGGDQVGQVAVPGDLAETDDGAKSGEERDLGGEMGGAVADLVREGLVSGWCTADD